MVVAHGAVFEEEADVVADLVEPLHAVDRRVGAPVVTQPNPFGDVSQEDRVVHRSSPSST